jgi:hypothetical protein
MQSSIEILAHLLGKKGQSLLIAHRNEINVPNCMPSLFNNLSISLDVRGGAWMRERKTAKAAQEVLY